MFSMIEYICGTPAKKFGRTSTENMNPEEVKLSRIILNESVSLRTNEKRGEMV